MAEAVGRVLPAERRQGDRVIVGNWADDSFLTGEKFDTVLLDYFIGAIDAFAPYSQETLIHRLAKATRGTLYVTGLEPYVPVVADEEVGRFIGDLGRLRDACQLLARDRPYREFPADWVAATLRRAGLVVTHRQFYKIRYRKRFLDSQLEICEARLQRFQDAALAAAMKHHIASIRRRGEDLMERHDGLRYGRDYLLRAVRSS